MGALWLLVSCGGSGGSEPPTLSEITLSKPPHEYRPLAPPKVAVEQRLERRIHRYCARAAAALTDQRQGPTPAELEAVAAGIHRIAKMAKREPYAVLPNGADLRLRLGDLAENLEGENCSPEIQARIEQELARIPAR